MTAENEFKAMCRLTADILKDCEQIMRITGCDYDTANEINTRKHPEKYKKMQKYLEHEN